MVQAAPVRSLAAVRRELRACASKLNPVPASAFFQLLREANDISTLKNLSDTVDAGEAAAAAAAAGLHRVVKALLPLVAAGRRHWTLRRCMLGAIMSGSVATVRLLARHEGAFGTPGFQKSMMRASIRSNVVAMVEWVFEFNNRQLNSTLKHGETLRQCWGGELFIAYAMSVEVGRFVLEVGRLKLQPRQPEVGLMSMENFLTMRQDGGIPQEMLDVTTSEFAHEFVCDVGASEEELQQLQACLETSAMVDNVRHCCLRHICENQAVRAQKNSLALSNLVHLFVSRCKQAEITPGIATALVVGQQFLSIRNAHQRGHLSKSAAISAYSWMASRRFPDAIDVPCCASWDTPRLCYNRLMRLRHYELGDCAVSDDVYGRESAGFGVLAGVFDQHASGPSWVMDVAEHSFSQSHIAESKSLRARARWIRIRRYVNLRWFVCWWHEIANQDSWHPDGRCGLRQLSQFSDLFGLVARA